MVYSSKLSSIIIISSIFVFYWIESNFDSILYISVKMFRNGI